MTDRRRLKSKVLETLTTATLIFLPTMLLTMSMLMVLTMLAMSARTRTAADRGRAGEAAAEVGAERDAVHDAVHETPGTLDKPSGLGPRSGGDKYKQDGREFKPDETGGSSGSRWFPGSPEPPGFRGASGSPGPSGGLKIVPPGGSADGFFSVGPLS
ncbi:MAG: hypothetical protein LBO05_02995 [Deltaproteobacteria bacterium]|jgi:uncharacterized membrane protein YgcG|nr:hypothetical protein [Deltaproteobacteria bacterium]